MANVRLFIGFFAIVSGIIPISVIINGEVMKGVQIKNILNDKNLKGPDERLKMFSLRIHEDLGDLKYVFCDKTGTLTKNEMLFSGLTVCDKVIKAHGNQFYRPYFSDGFNPDEIAGLINDFEDIYHLDLPGLSRHDMIKQLFLNIMLNNEAIAEEMDGKLVYSSVSCDEVALLEAAGSLGFKMLHRSEKDILVEVEEQQSVFEILHSFEFTSTRARSSAIVKDEERRIWLYCKGADNKILNMLDEETSSKVKSYTENHLEIFSSSGLRTLAYGYKEISESDYEKWSQIYYAEKEKALKMQENEVESLIDQIENGLTLLGGTALEDKLQDEVMQSIKDMRMAGIKVWMLTGDKLNTAESIGHSCGLLERDQKILKIPCASFEEVEVVVENFLADLQKMNSKILIEKKDIDLTDEQFYTHSSLKEESSSASVIGMSDLELLIHLRDSSLARECEINVIDELIGKCKGNGIKSFDALSSLQPISILVEETSITHLLDPRLKEKVLVLLETCTSVICCRCSPIQKANVVEYVKNNLNQTTLAIGDGGNDVNMIRAANIGVGIFGKEGLQAAYNSDYAISQFRYLSYLVLHFGRKSFRRNAYFYYAFFFKNNIHSFPSIYLNLHVAFSGMVIS